MQQQVRNFIIAPSILAADFAKLGQEVADVVVAGADWLHFDVMDNHYVPNLTMGPAIAAALKPYCGKAKLDVHLMVTPIDDMICQFAKAGADIITFHPEATGHIDRSLALIKELGVRAGLAFNPATPLDYLDYVLDKLDVILLMSVNPGFGGQSFIPAILDKIKHTRSIIDNGGRNIMLEVDGGINATNICQIYEAGADVCVAGTAIYGKPNYTQAIMELKEQILTTAYER